ncbi:MAG: hypothetical protein U0354_10825 [Candidatus Sericytochromatia bacterium]
MIKLLNILSIIFFLISCSTNQNINNQILGSNQKTTELVKNNDDKSKKFNLASNQDIFLLFSNKIQIIGYDKKIKFEENNIYCSGITFLPNKRILTTCKDNQEYKENQKSYYKIVDYSNYTSKSIKLDSINADYNYKISPDSEKISFINFKNGISSLYVLDFNSKLTKIYDFEKQYSNSYTWTPNSDKIVYSLDDSIYISNSDATNKKRLTTNKLKNINDINISFDGKYISYTSSDEYYYRNLYIMKIDGSETKNLGYIYSTKYDVIPESEWLPDRNEIVFLQLREYSGDINIYNPETNQKELIEKDANFVIDKKNKYISFYKDKSIYYVDFNDKNRTVRKVEEKEFSYIIKTNDLSKESISPDYKKIVYVEYILSNFVICSGECAHNIMHKKLFIHYLDKKKNIDIDIVEDPSFSYNEFFYEHIKWSNDSKYIIFNKRNNNGKINSLYIYDTDTNQKDVFLELSDYLYELELL